MNLSRTRYILSRAKLGCIENRETGYSVDSLQRLEWRNYKTGPSANSGSTHFPTVLDRLWISDSSTVEIVVGSTTDLKIPIPLPSVGRGIKPSSRTIGSACLSPHLNIWSFFAIPQILSDGLMDERHRLSCVVNPTRS